MGEDFAVRTAIDRYTSRITSEIKSKKRRKEVKQEYTEHLEDAVYYHAMHGIPEKQAFDLACENMGEVSKLQSMLAAVHNKDPLPSWIKWGLCFLGIVTYALLYQWNTHPILHAWLTFGIQSAMILCIVTVITGCGIWVAAMVKHGRTMREIRKYTCTHGLVLHKNSSPFLSLFKRSATPEWVIDTPHRRYVISLWPTIRPRRHLYFHFGGLYTYHTPFAFLLMGPAFAPFSRASAYIPGGSVFDAPSFNMSYMNAENLPKGTHLMPTVTYKDLDSMEKENIHILLLSPAPTRVYLLERHRCRQLSEGDVLPEALGGVRIYTADGLISLWEEIRIFGREGGKKKKY